MWVTAQERATLTGLGLAALLGLSVLIWQRHPFDSAQDAVPSAIEGRQRPPLVIEGAPNAEETAHWDGALASARQVDVNTAGAAELERLPGVGPGLARRITEYRTQHGSFHSAEELMRVRGIGPKTLEALREYVAVNE